MDGIRANIAVLCVLMLLAPAGSFAADQPPVPPCQQPPNGQPQAPFAERGIVGSLTASYRAKIPAPVNLNNSPRLESLIRAGNLYLSLQDTIALALENNLDIELQRYTPQISDTNLLRTQAGGFASPVSTSVFAGPSSVTGAAPSSGLEGLLIAGSTQLGPTPPSFDPALIGGLSWAHQTTPQTSSFITGTNSLIQRQDLSSIAAQQYFTSGTLVNLGLSNNNTITNSARSDFSPVTNASLSLTVTQHLLQGFGVAVNTRQIHIARNNREVSDLTFRAQVITTVAAVMDLYWDLVSYNENVRVQRDALAADDRLLRDNTKQVEVGTLASIEIVRAQAEIASAQQALTVADPTAAAGDDPQDRAEPDRPAESRGGLGARHPDGPHSGAGCRSYRAHPGYGGPGVCLQTRAVAIPHSDAEPGNRHQGHEERTAAHSGPGGFSQQQWPGGPGEPDPTGGRRRPPRPHGLFRGRIRHRALATLCAQLSELRDRFQLEYTVAQPHGAGRSDRERTGFAATTDRRSAVGKPGSPGSPERRDRRAAEPGPVRVRHQAARAAAADRGGRAEETGNGCVHHLQCDPDTARLDHGRIERGGGHQRLLQGQSGNRSRHRPDALQQQRFAGRGLQGQGIPAGWFHSGHATVGATHECKFCVQPYA